MNKKKILKSSISVGLILYAVVLLVILKSVWRSSSVDQDMFMAAFYLSPIIILSLAVGWVIGVIVPASKE